MTDMDWKQLKRDREQGTPGPWRIENCVSYGDRSKAFFMEIWNDETDVLVTTEVTRAHNDGGTPNMRRIARLPEVEAYALTARKRLEAADVLAEAVRCFEEKQGTVPGLRKALDAYKAAKGGKE